MDSLASSEIFWSEGEHRIRYLPRHLESKALTLDQICVLAGLCIYTDHCHSDGKQGQVHCQEPHSRATDVYSNARVDELYQIGGFFPFYTSRSRIN